MAAYNLPYSGINYKTIGNVVLFLSHFFSTYLNLRQYFKLNDKRMPKKLKELKGYEISTEDFFKTKEYNSEKMAFTIVKSTIELLLTALLIMINFYPMVWEAFFQYTGNMYLSIILFTIFETIRGTLVDIPFSYYYTFHLESKYEFNKTTHKTFITDKIKGVLLTIIIGNIFYCLITLIMEYFQEKFVVIAWIATTILTLIIVFLYPSVIAPLFNKFESLDLNNEKEKTIQEELEKLCKEIGFPLGKIYKMDGSKRSAHSQAYFFGIFGKKQIVVYDTLIEKTSVKEILAIVGHELGHWKHKHNIVMIVMQVSVIGIFLGTLSLMLENDKFYYDFGFSNKYYFMGLTMFSIFFAPLNILIHAISCSVTRVCEYQADRFSVKLNRGQDLLDGLIQIYKDNKGDPDPDHIYALFNHTHPNLLQRAEAIQLELSKRK